jgi:hypothetical protein
MDESNAKASTEQSPAEHDRDPLPVGQRVKGWARRQALRAPGYIAKGAFIALGGALVTVYVVPYLA